MPSFKKEEKEVAAPEPELPEPEELPPPPPPESAPEPVGDLLVGSMQLICIFDDCRSNLCLSYQLLLVLAMLSGRAKSDYSSSDGCIELSRVTRRGSGYLSRMSICD